MRAAATAGACVLAFGCARPLLGPEDGFEGGSSGEIDDASPADDSSTGDDSSAADSSTGDAPGQPSCHPSYVPCLPIVDDLNCPDVVALGAAPVMVVGPDAYGLDADGDGIGCE